MIVNKYEEQELTDLSGKLGAIAYNINEFYRNNIVNELDYQDAFDYLDENASIEDKKRQTEINNKKARAIPVFQKLETSYGEIITDYLSRFTRKDVKNGTQLIEDNLQLIQALTRKLEEISTQLTSLTPLFVTDDEKRINAFTTSFLMDLHMSSELQLKVDKLTEHINNDNHTLLMAGNSLGVDGVKGLIQKSREHFHPDVANVLTLYALDLLQQRQVMANMKTFTDLMNFIDYQYKNGTINLRSLLILLSLPLDLWKPSLEADFKEISPSFMTKVLRKGLKVVK